jgi:hypothetical protein
VAIDVNRCSVGRRWMFNVAKQIVIDEWRSRPPG